MVQWFQSDWFPPLQGLCALSFSLFLPCSHGGHVYASSEQLSACIPSLGCGYGMQGRTPGGDGCSLGTDSCST